MSDSELFPRLFEPPDCYPHDTGPIVAEQYMLDIGSPDCDATRTHTLSSDPDFLLQLKFPAAAKLWLATRKPYLRERTFAMYEHHVSSLGKYFGELLIGKIHINHLRQYQLARLGNHNNAWKNKAGPSLIRHEIWIVEAVLKRAGRWKYIGPYYEPLPLPMSGKPKVMTQTEEMRLFDIAQSSPEFELAYLVASLTVNTSAAGSELRNIRLRDLALNGPKPSMTVDAETSKNQARARTIPLNPTASHIAALCVARAKSKGSIHPDHYLFPKRIVRGIWDPYKPASASWLRNSFKAMREAADLPWLTPHCLRHQAITKLLEYGVAPEVVRGIAGHVTETMMKHYSHSRYSAASDALSKIDSGMNNKSVAYRKQA
jgi:integrase